MHKISSLHNCIVLYTDADSAKHVDGDAGIQTQMPPTGASVRYIVPKASLRSAAARGEERKDRDGSVDVPTSAVGARSAAWHGLKNVPSTALIDTRRDLDEVPKLHHSSFNKVLHKSDKTAVFFFLTLFYFVKLCGSTWCLANWHTIIRMMSV